MMGAENEFAGRRDEEANDNFLGTKKKKLKIHGAAEGTFEAPS
jgi:hypothetical protein